MVAAVQKRLIPRRDVMINVLPYFHIYGRPSCLCITFPPVNMPFRCRQTFILSLLLRLSRSRFA
jgi:hypothetical protein